MMDLYICLTPLQILITNNLIKLKRKSSEVLVLTYTLNSKYTNYISIVKDNYYVKKVSVIEINNTSFLGKVFTFKRVINWCKKKEFSSISLASIDNFYMHFVISRCLSSKGNIYTFDDGTMNIVRNSNYFVTNLSFISRVARSVLNINWDVMRIKLATQKHYTIYDNMENIVSNTEYIGLFEQYRQRGINHIGNVYGKDIGKEERVISIYLGQPFIVSPFASIQIYKSLLKHFGVDEGNIIQYYPHPRENLSFIERELGENNVLRSNLIIEDYIIRFIDKGVKINLYTVSSSTGFNLYSYEGVMVYFIKSPYIKNEVKEIYDLIDDKSLRTLDLTILNE